MWLPSCQASDQCGVTNMVSSRFRFYEGTKQAGFSFLPTAVEVARKLFEHWIKTGSVHCLFLSNARAASVPLLLRRTSIVRKYRSETGFFTLTWCT